MSEGKYGRLPKPKDRSKSRVAVGLGDVTLEPQHDKAGEWAEEGDTYVPHHAKPAPEEGLLARLGRTVSEAASSVSRPWARLTDDDEEK